MLSGFQKTGHYWPKLFLLGTQLSYELAFVFSFGHVYVQLWDTDTICVYLCNTDLSLCRTLSSPRSEADGSQSVFVDSSSCCGFFFALALPYSTTILPSQLPALWTSTLGTVTTALWRLLNYSHNCVRSDPFMDICGYLLKVLLIFLLPQVEKT